MSTPSLLKKIDHLGIAVPNLDAAIALYTTLLGQGPDHRETVAEQKVNAAFFSVGESNIELLEPTAPDSPISKFLDKRGGGIHHLCVEVADIEACLAHYAAAGVELIDKTPRQGAHGKRIALIHPKSTGGVLIELSQKVERAGSTR